MNIQFTKMHGAGNDFIIINEFQKILIPEKNKSEFSARVSDRHFGIGSDGVIFVQKSKTEDAKMLFYNPDGSRAEICGNGIRCFAKYLYDTGIVKKKKIRVETFSGRVISEILIRGQGPRFDGRAVEISRPLVSNRSFDVAERRSRSDICRRSKAPPHTRGVELNGKIRADMGSPIVEFINRIFRIDGNSYKITSVNMGNPHAILFLDNIENINVRTIGSSIRNLKKLFKNGTNVHFVQKIGKNRFKIRSYERGVEDETLACGTGICAAGVAAVLNRLANGEKPIKFHARGGDLTIELETYNKNKIKRVYMAGPAEEVFTGEIKFQL